MPMEGSHLQGPSHIKDKPNVCVWEGGITRQLRALFLSSRRDGALFGRDERLA